MSLFEDASDVINRNPRNCFRIIVGNRVFWQPAICFGEMPGSDPVACW
jgi:hypothetical protein